MNSRPRSRVSVRRRLGGSGANNRRLGRPTADAASALGPGLDGAVRRLGREYDPLGRVLRVTSYSAASGGSVVNQVEWVYNGLGQPTAESQAHGGSVNQATTPQVQTAYADGGQNTARPTTLTYPSGRVVGFSYGAAGGDGDRLSRVVGLDDAGPTPRPTAVANGRGDPRAAHQVASRARPPARRGP